MKKRQTTWDCQVLMYQKPVVLTDAFHDSQSLSIKRWRRFFKATHERPFNFPACFRFCTSLSTSPAEARSIRDKATQPIITQ